MKKKSNFKLVLMSIALALLVLFAGMQSLELANLKEKVNVLSSAVDSAGAASSANSGAQLQKSLNDLPAMVGGC